MVMGERDLGHQLTNRATYHSAARTHLALDKDAPSVDLRRNSAASCQSRGLAACITNTFGWYRQAHEIFGSHNYFDNLNTRSRQLVRPPPFQPTTAGRPIV
jgi:hypothetical protein